MVSPWYYVKVGVCAHVHDAMCVYSVRRTQSGKLYTQDYLCRCTVRTTYVSVPWTWHRPARRDKEDHSTRKARPGSTGAAAWQQQSTPIQTHTDTSTHSTQAHKQTHTNRMSDQACGSSCRSSTSIRVSR